MSKVVRDFIEDTLRKVRDDVSFSYARESDFNAIQNKTYPAVLLKPLSFTPKRVGYTINREYKVTLLFYALDSLEGAEDETKRFWMKWMSWLPAFSRSKPFRSLSVDDDPEEDVTSDKITISKRRGNSTDQVHPTTLRGISWILF